MKRHLCGPHAVDEAMSAGAHTLAVIMVSPDDAVARHAPLVARARKLGVQIEMREMSALDSIARGVRHQGIMGVGAADFPYSDLESALTAASSPPLFVALDEITDVHNFGAIIRSSVALGADAVITLRDRAAPVNAAVIRASAGATEHARIARVTNLSRALSTLVERGFTVVGLDARGDSPLAEIPLGGAVALVVGSEGRGIRRLVREHCTQLARVPMAGPIGSLNASVAAAIALYEVVRQRAAR